MRRSRRPGTQDRPVLITEAARSYQEEHDARRRKYAIMMGLRVPLLVAAAFAYKVWWLALILILLSVVLPWMAVLIANDRPALKTERMNRFRHETRATQLEAREHPVIDG